MSDVLESRWFKVSVLIFSGVSLAYSAWQLSIAARLRTFVAANPNTTAISASEVEWSFWVSIIILIISIFFFVWAAMKLLFSKKYRDEKSKSLGEWLESDEGVIGTETETEPVYGKKTEIIERQVPCDAAVSATRKVPSYGTYSSTKSSIRGSSPTRRVTTTAKRELPVDTRFRPARATSSLYPE